MSLESDTQMTQDVGEASTLNREEEYRRAQISGTEAIMVGRETLETVVRQGEQLQVGSRGALEETRFRP